MLQIFQQIKMIIRIRKFRQLFSKLNIIKKLDNSLESWDYERLDETSRVANEIKKQLS
jgi:mitochondrial fission protein ELM1